jgi:hypothetical protein
MDLHGERGIGILGVRFGSLTDTTPVRVMSALPPQARGVRFVRKPPRSSAATRAGHGAALFVLVVRRR